MESSISGWAGRLREYVFTTERAYLFVAKDRKLGKAEAGVSLIAAITKAPIIPAAIVNTEKIFSSEVKFPRLAVVYGMPLKFTGSTKDRNALDSFAQSIMNEIAKLKADAT